MNTNITANIKVVSGIETVDSFTLKDELGISTSTKHAHWVKRAISRGRLVEGEDYITSTVGDQKVSGVQLGVTSKERKVSGVRSNTTSKERDDTVTYHFSLDAVEIIAMLTDSDVGHAVRKQMQGYKKAYITLVQHQLENQKNIIKTYCTEGSLSGQAKNAGYRVASDVLKVMNLSTSPMVVKRIAEYSMVPSIEIGTHTYYSVVHFIEAYRKFLADSELKTVQCKVTYQHVFTGLVFEHK